MKTKQAEMPLEAETVESTELAAPVSATPAIPTGDNPSDMIRFAIQHNASVEVMNGLFELSQRMNAVTAKKAFDEAMADFQSRCPMIKKSRKGSVAKYAGLEDVVGQTKELLREFGFSYSLNTRVVDGKLFAVCFAKHLGGHSEESSFPCTPITGTGAMSEIMKVSASVTFAKRQVFINAFGIICCDEDTDGHGGGKAEAPAREAAALKRELILITAKVHECTGGKLTDDGKIALTDWLRENKHMKFDETLGSLSDDRLREVIASVKGAKK